MMARLSFLVTLCVTTAIAQSPELAHTPNDSLVDVFPLSIGNQWTYLYQYEYEADPGISPMYHWGDTGTVTLRIIDKVVSDDSTRWVVHETGSHWTQSNEQPWNGPRLESDTFEIIESHVDDHFMYRTGRLAEIRTSLLPFAPNLVDTARVVRYTTIDPGGSRTFRTHDVDSAGINDLRLDYFFHFERGVGLVWVMVHTTITGWPNYGTSHTLRSSLIVGISAPPDGGQLEACALGQNYPNPFNLTTQIPYDVVGALADRSGAQDVLLVVYDLLGRAVAVLVNEEKGPGSYEVMFDASGLGAGVYYYRLAAGSVVQTRKMIVVK